MKESSSLYVLYSSEIKRVYLHTLPNLCIYSQCNVKNLDHYKKELDSFSFLHGFIFGLEHIY